MKLTERQFWYVSGCLGLIFAWSTRLIVFAGAAVAFVRQQDNLAGFQLAMLFLVWPSHGEREFSRRLIHHLATLP